MENRDRPIESFTLAAEGITKRFNRRLIFQDLSFTLASGESMAITGKNGSGKSTLVKILCGLLSPTKGVVRYTAGKRTLTTDHVRDRLGLVSPYLQMYDEFTGIENLELLSKIRSNTESLHERAESVLNRVGLWERRNDFVRTYSSGMKQRLKYAFALLHQPEVLVLDEPTSNLDADGVVMVTKVLGDQQQSGILIIATNDTDEAGWCRDRIHLGQD